MAIYRAWRFVHPVFDSAEDRTGLRISATGGIAMVDGHALIRQAILLLLSTVPGERVMRPDYGCDLHRLLFLPNDDTTAGLAIHYIRRALLRWEPRIEILRLDARRSDASLETLDLFLEYRVRSTLYSDQLIFTLNLARTEA